MPEQNHQGIQSYKNEEATLAISQYRVAVLGTGAESMKLPGAANVGGIVGVTVAQVDAGEIGAMVYAGIAYVTAYGVIAKGDDCVIGDTSGRVAAKPAGATAQAEGIVGTALKAAGAQGDIIPLQLSIRNEYAT